MTQFGWVGRERIYLIRIYLRIYHFMLLVYTIHLLFLFLSNHFLFETLKTNFCSEVLLLLLKISTKAVIRLKSKKCFFPLLFRFPECYRDRLQDCVVV